MLNKIKLSALKKSTFKSLEKRDISQRNTKLKNLGFLTHEMFFDDYEMLYNLGMELGVQRKDIKIFSFTETNKKVPSLRQDQITNKEFNWRGEIQNPNAKEFINFPFDALIGIYKNKNEFLDAMIAMSGAKFKIGFEGADERLFDLVMNIDPKNADLFKAEVKKYLKVFNKI